MQRDHENIQLYGHVCFDKNALSAFPAMLLPSNEILENWTRIFGVENDTSVHQTFHKIKNMKNATSVHQKCYFHLPMILPSIYGKKFREYAQNKHAEDQKKIFQNHQTIITKLISDNNILINQRLYLFATEMNERKASFEMTDIALSMQAKDIKYLQTKSKTLKTNEEAVKNLLMTTTSLQEKIVDLEN